MSHDHSHDGHTHSQTELILAKHVQRLEKALEMLTMSDTMLRRAMVKVLGPAGQVTIDLDQDPNDELYIEHEGAAAKQLTMFVEADGKLNIRLGE